VIPVETLRGLGNQLTKENKMTDKAQIAEKLAEKLNGKAWVKYDADGNMAIARVYTFKRDFLQVNDDGVNIDRLNGGAFDDAKAAIVELGLTHYRR
jgi:hypothetical protein